MARSQNWALLTVAEQDGSATDFLCLGLCLGRNTLNDLQRRTDAIIALYLLMSAGLVVSFRERVPHWELYVTAHLLGAAFIYTFRFISGRLPSFLQFLRDWYPMMVLPLLYQEVEVFAAAFGNWGLTERIQQLEINLFQGHPSIYLSERFDWVPLSEYLHFCYFAYVLLFPLVGGYWYARKRMRAFRELLFLLCATLTISFLFFLLFPVDSPFYLSDPPGEPLRGHFFYDLVHFISGRGGARGGAFPSSHVSVATVIWLVAWRHQRRIAWLLTPIVGGLILATVYGRFHYVLDVFAGLGLAILIVATYSVIDEGPNGPESMEAKSEPQDDATPGNADSDSQHPSLSQ